MSTITTRSGKGSPLTNNEVDANFTNLNTDKLESADLAGYATLSGATFTGEVEATGFNGDLTGAILFKGQAGEALTKGDPVYISGISGNKTVVSKADANDANKMPCFGIVDATVSANADCSVVTFGTLQGLDTSSFSEGDELFVSDTGTLTTTAPTGESSQIQKIGKVTRSHASTGSIKVMGAGRTNAVPNLNDGQFFLGNGSNQAVSTDFTTSVLGEISAGTGIGISGSGVISNSAPDQTVSLTGAGTTTVSGTYPNFTITGAGTTYTAGSGLSLTGTEFANTAPDQTVALTGAGATSISGTYPNFTITSTNTTYSVGDGGLTEINFTSADNTKLDGIEAGATADQTAAQILTAIKTVDGSGSGLDADTVDGVEAIQLYRRTGSAAGTAGSGWVTVASNVNGRKHGEVIVSDSDSGDHSFIRIDWLRSYGDSEFTVINSGGHANRITAVRVLEQTSDLTYGTKYLQVLTTTSSTYSVRINTLADVGGYSSHTAVTPQTQNAITGYQTGAATELLDSNNLASSQGIASGNGVFQSTAEDAELKYYYNGSSFSGLKASISGVVTTASSGRIRFGSSSASFIMNGPGVTSNLTIAANGGSTFFYGSTGAVAHHATIASQSRFDCGYGSVQNAYMVRAWGRFEMTGTHSWRDDEGFSSITDVATGRSRLNFTNTMPNSYYSVQVTAGTTSYTNQVAAANIYSASTSQFYISVEDVDGAFIDKDHMNVTVVR